MIPLPQQDLDPLTPADHRQVVRLFQRAPRSHIHYDWRTLEEWLPHPDFCAYIARRRGVVESMIGATVHQAPIPDSPTVAWLRFILPATSFGHDPALDALWDRLQADLQARQVRQVALLAIDEWTGQLAQRWGYDLVNAVITLRRTHGLTPPIEPPYAVREVRSAEDLQQVAAIDAAAFKPPWVYNYDTILVAQRQATTLTVIENEDRMLGYQLSTSHSRDGHLARLAVLPDFQGRGLGGMLIGEMVRFFEGRGVTTLTVNTQEDNLASQHLYRRLGFYYTGHRVPVWSINL